MKIKILFAPALIILTIVMIIWHAYPAYTNGLDGVKEKAAKLDQQKKTIENLDKFSGNTTKLVADLNANSFENATVLSYIPENKEEEKIIENLNSLAKDSMLSVLNISILELKDPEVLAPEVTTGISANTLPGLVQNQVQVPVSVTPKAVPKKMEAEFSVVGDYGSIKNLLEKIQKVKRFNKVSALEIKTLLKEDQTISESLQASIKLEFNYLKPLKRLEDGDIDNKIFSEGVFDKKAIGKIRSSRSIEINNVLPGEKRGSNPFIIPK